MKNTVIFLKNFVKITMVMKRFDYCVRKSTLKSTSTVKHINLEASGLL